MPHQHRHVLGWYRLIHELREHGIRTICVFDGEERTSAKNGEQIRRRHLRRTDALRGEIESDRLQRLLALTRGFDALRLLDKNERLLTVTLVRNQMSSLEGQLVPEHDQEQPSSPSRLLQRHLSDVELNVAQRDMPWPDEVDLDELYHESGQSVGVRFVPPDDIDAVTGDHYSAGTEDPDFYHFGQQPLLPFSAVSQSESRDDDLVGRLTGIDIDLPEDYQEGEKWPSLASSLTDLYAHYRRGVAKLGVMPSTVISATPSVFASQEHGEPANAQAQLDMLSSTIPLIHLPSDIPSGPVDPADAHVQAAMSKTQYQLTVEEGKLWEKLTDPDEAVDQDESPTAAILESLRERSSFMVQSYLRRNNPPTETTYEESKNILHAMGVPCIESTGPYEAEALASSLVLNGRADYVASEDTDVLIYGAPLLRNITNRDKSLLLISGSEVRSALHLDARAFVDFALLLGTDFAPRVRNIGPRRALQYIRKYGTIECMLAEEKRHVPRVPLQTYLQAVRDARDVFVRLPPVPDPHVLEPGEYREGEVAAILASHRLQRFLEPDTLLDTLQGNYFNDNPAVVI